MRVFGSQPVDQFSPIHPGHSDVRDYQLHGIVQFPYQLIRCEAIFGLDDLVASGTKYFRDQFANRGFIFDYEDTVVQRAHPTYLPKISLIGRGTVEPHFSKTHSKAQKASAFCASFRSLDGGLLRRALQNVRP
jgi:hypothetical protein